MSEPPELEVKQPVRSLRAWNYGIVGYPAVYRGMKKKIELRSGEKEELGEAAAPGGIADPGRTAGPGGTAGGCKKC
jgi:hypothetical protein